MGLTNVKKMPYWWTMASLSWQIKVTDGKLHIAPPAPANIEVDKNNDFFMF